jgi:hypothetical protein
MVDEARGKSEANAKGQRGRSAEARSADRPVDPVTGEKEGLGSRWRDTAPEEPDVPVVTTPMEPPATETPPSSV